MVAGALALDPLAVGIIAGVGGALGELTGYALGRSSHRLVRGAVLPGWLSRYADRHMGATLLAMYTIPSPFMDAAGILAGRLRYPLPLFLTYSLIGKVVQSIVFVYLVLWNVSLFNSWAGLA